MPLTAEEMELAENCYGYGKWTAKYWFIGPEQGMDKENYETDIRKRHRAFVELQNDGLCDCQEFHRHIGGNKYLPNDGSQRAKLQKTWNYQMVLLGHYLDKTCNADLRRAYQTNKLGSSSGETCIVELRGLPAYKAYLSKEQTRHREARITRLKAKIERAKPDFVVFYGSEGESWSQIAQCEVPFQGIAVYGGTVFAYVPHPNARKDMQKDHAYWAAMGRKIRLRRAHMSTGN